MTDAVKCPTCDTQMEVGFVPTSKGGASRYPAAWHPSPPDAEKSFWEKVKTGGAGVKVDDAKLLPVSAFRCARCGLLRFYAMD